jgi:hypothetical protein
MQDERPDPNFLQAKGTTVNALLNALLKKDIELIEQAA